MNKWVTFRKNGDSYFVFYEVNDIKIEIGIIHLLDDTYVYTPSFIFPMTQNELHHVLRKLDDLNSALFTGCRNLMDEAYEEEL